MPLFEKAAKDYALAAELCDAADFAEDESIQITLRSSEASSSIRNLASGNIGKLVKISGMVTASNKVTPKATKLVVQCKNCSDQYHMSMHLGLKGSLIPRSCQRNGTRQAEEAACPMDPYEILPDRW
jgi:DNA replication licensing factor MCM5